MHVTRRRRRSRTTISIFGGIGTEESISASTAGAKPAATGRVGEAEKAKYNQERAVPTKQSVVGTDLYPNIVYCVEGARRLREAPAKGSVA